MYLLYFLIFITIISCNKASNYPETIKAFELQKQYDSALWAYYRSNYLIKGNLYDFVKKSYIKDTVRLIDYEPYFRSVDIKGKKDDTLVINFTNECKSYDIETVHGFMGKFAFVKDNPNILYRKWVSHLIFPTLEKSHYLSDKLLPKNYHYIQGKHPFWVEEEKFTKFLKENKDNIKNKWLLLEAKRRKLIE